MNHQEAAPITGTETETNNEKPVEIAPVTEVAITPEKNTEEVDKW